jgi:hypothetical protein
MNVSKEEFININMTMDEAKRFLMLIEEVSAGGCNMPTWAKTAAAKIADSLSCQGVQY